MKHAMKNMMKLGSIALALPLMLAPLCQAQTQWSSEQDLGGDPASLPYAIQVPGTNILQFFFQGTDNGLCGLVGGTRRTETRSHSGPPMGKPEFLDRRDANGRAFTRLLVLGRGNRCGDFPRLGRIIRHTKGIHATRNE